MIKQLIHRYLIDKVPSSSLSVDWTDGLASTTSHLSFHLKSAKFKSPLEIVCFSTIPSIYSNKVNSLNLINHNALLKGKFPWCRLLLIVLYQVVVRADFDGTVESVLGSPLLSASPVVKLNLKMVKTISLLLLIIN